MAVVLLLALSYGATAGGGALRGEARADAIARDIRCPVCAGLSIAESDAPAAQAMRLEIRSRVDEGQSDEEVRAYIAAKYPDSSLRPPTSGVAGLVWALPVAAAVLAAAGMVVAFRRWKQSPSRPLTVEDQHLVDEALRR